jgi:dihydroorotase
MRTIIRNAEFVDAQMEYGKSDLMLRDGIIEGINLDGNADFEYNADGCLVTPAFLDLHNHLREPGQEVKEDLTSGLSAAAAGGYGSVVSMANTSPVVEKPEQVSRLIKKAQEIGKARLYPAAALSRGSLGKQLTDFADLQEAGAVMVTDDGSPVHSGKLMHRACECAKKLDLVIQTHSEDLRLCKDGVIHEGSVSKHLNLPGNPIAAEAVMIYRDCTIAQITGARVHISHISSKQGMQIVELFKEQGTAVTAEITPHHLTLTEDSIYDLGALAKVAPPLRTNEDVEYLREALQRGVVDNIGTDHAPHTRTEKEQDLQQAPFGIANIEVCFPLLYTKLVRTNILTLHALLALFQQGPAKVMGFPIPLLKPGSPADITVIDLANPHVVNSATFQSKAKFSPWEGESLWGWPQATFVRGNQVFKHSPSLE